MVAGRPGAARRLGHAGTLCSMPFGIGATEIVILLLVALLVFGPKKLPEMGRSLGRGMREFKDSIQGKDDAVEDARRELATPTDENEPVVTARERDSV
jgi:sec-independent protein translocase protein TatA